MTESKELKQITRKVYDLGYLQCRKPQHERQDLSYVCLEDECQGNRLLCCHCEQNQHQQHLILPFKEYILQIYKSRLEVSSSYIYKKSHTLQTPEAHTRIQLLPTEKLSTINDQVNYLSFIYAIENKKIQALKSLNTLREKFLNQLSEVQTGIRLSATRYIQKLKVVSELQFGKLNLVERITKLVGENKLSKLNSLLQLYFNNFNLSQTVFDKSQVTPSQQEKVKQKNQNQQLLMKVQESFSSKINNFTKTINRFDSLFIPKLSQLILYEDIKYSQNSTKYEWDPLMKAKHLQIEKNNKVIKAISDSVNNQRFALMKKSFPPNSKGKYTWAIKINKLVGWIGVGMVLKKQISAGQFKFINYNTIGHGCYMISNNCYTWSHSQTDQNSKSLAFPFYTGDTIIMQYNPSAGELTFKRQTVIGVNTSFVLKVAEYPKDEELCPCVNMCSINHQVQIVDVPSCN